MTQTTTYSYFVWTSRMSRTPAVFKLCE